MARFFRLRDNADDVRTLKCLECNYFKDAANLTALQRRVFDVISHESNSYFTTLHRVRVGVGEGDEMLPPPPKALRMYSKCAAPRMRASTTDHGGPCGELNQDCPQQNTTPRCHIDMDRLERDFREDRENALAMKDFFRRYKHCVSATVLLAEMPEELRAWLTSDPP